MPSPVEEADDAQFRKRFGVFLHRKVGLSEQLLESLRTTDDDWSFVIKINGLMEVALNHLILARLNSPKLEDFVRRLEIGDKRRGKLAIIKALDLLPENGSAFVSRVARLRGEAGHGIKYFDLNLAEYFKNLNPTERNNWKDAIGWGFSPPLLDSLLEFELIYPRTAIYDACMRIMAAAFHAQPGGLLEVYRNLLRKEDQKRSESTPKE